MLKKMLEKYTWITNLFNTDINIIDDLLEEVPDVAEFCQLSFSLSQLTCGDLHAFYGTASVEKAKPSSDCLLPFVTR